MSEKYTIDVLKHHIHIHRNYLSKLDRLSNKYNVSFRKPIFPESISENIIKHIIIKKFNHDITWDCSGDLYSKDIGKIECKAFASDGPISFGHSQEWNIIYFLDLNDWYSDNIIKLYQLKLKNSSSKWLNIKVNKNENIQSIYLKKQRAKISWKQLYPQIENNIEKIYEGSLDKILFRSCIYNLVFDVINFPLKCITKVMDLCLKKKKN